MFTIVVDKRTYSFHRPMDSSLLLRVTIIRPVLTKPTRRLSRGLSMEAHFENLKQDIPDQC